MKDRNINLSREATLLTGAGLDVMADKHPRLFMGLVHHPTTKGKRMTFRDKPWLAAIYKDNSYNMVIIKCSQVHMTEHALCAMFTYAQKGKRGMYILPSKEHRKTFVNDRINKSKDYSPLYEKAIKSGDTESDSNVYKSIFNRGWKFVGSNVRKDFFEFPCDVLFFDEYDELHQDNIIYSYDRVANCNNPLIWKFGNPTRDNFGIHAEFLLSDQKEWHVECEHCNREQILDWYEHFVTPHHGTWRLRHPSGSPICLYCGETFDRLGYGRWVAMNPKGKGITTQDNANRASGYRISRLFVKKKEKYYDVIKLFKQFIKAQNNPTALQNFHNNYLGTTYENIDFKLTKEVLDRSVWKDENNKPAFEFDPALYRTVMGVDQGKMFTCVISMVWDGELIDVHYTNVKRWADVEKLESDFNVVSTVVDAQGGGYAETRDFVNAKGSRYMCYYRPKDSIKGKLPYNLNYQDHIVETNRTEILDLMVKSLLDKKTHVRADYNHSNQGAFIKQMLVPSRITDTAGRPIWTKGTDHFFHGCAYRYLAFRISGMTHSIASNVDWHTERTLDKEQPEPKERIIGEVISKKKSETPEKKSWHV